MQIELCLIEFYDRGLHPVDRFINPSKVRYLTLAKGFPKYSEIQIRVYYDQLYKCFWIFIGDKIRIRSNGKSTKSFLLTKEYYSVMHSNESKFEYTRINRKATEIVVDSMNGLVREYY